MKGKNQNFRKVFSLLLPGLIILVCSIEVGYSQQENIYISQSAIGNNTGSDAANAHAVNWFNDPLNWTTVQGNDGLIGPGDIVHFCSTFSASARENLFKVQGSGIAGNPITIFFEQNAKLTSPCFEAVPGNHNAGAIVIHSKQHIVIDGGANGIIENTETGSITNYTYYRTSSTENNISGTIGITIYNSNNIEIKNITCQNLYVADENLEQPLYPGRYGEVGTWTNSVGICCDNSDSVFIHNNYFTYVGHGIRLGMLDNTGIEISYNEMYKTGVSVFSGGYTNLDGTNVEFHHNFVHDMTPWAYNDGIKFFGVPSTTDPYKGIKVYDNIIGPKVSYAEHPSTAYILADQGWIIEPEIYNNLLIGDEFDNPMNAYITVGGCHPDYGLGMLAQNSKIYNNTIISEYPGLDIGILLLKNSTGHKIYNNILKFKGNLLAIDYNEAQVEIAECDNNLFYTEGYLYFTNFIDFDEWQTNYGFDNNSLIADPLLDEDFKPTETSPVIDKGRALNSTYADTDLEGNKRGQGEGWDIGAYEYIISEITDKTQLHQIYPNPAKSDITIESQILSSASIELYNLSGMKVLQKKITANRQIIDISACPEGMYVYKIFSNSNQFKYGKLLITR